MRPAGPRRALRTAGVRILLLASLAGARAGLAAEPAAEATRGREVFEHRCAMCHREGGTGSFVLARRLGKERALLERRADLEPTYVRRVVRWGLLNMPRISRVELPDRDLDAVIAYLGGPRP